MVLSITIAHTQIEATKSPTMTVLTSQCACQNKVSSDRSEEVSGNADCARSAGFMRHPFGSPANRHHVAIGCAPSQELKWAYAAALDTRSAPCRNCAKTRSVAQGG